jgi:hypothetical protein
MKKTYLLFCIAIILLSSCTKAYLDKKPDQSLLVPTTIEDFQAILDNYNVMNLAPTLNSVACDDYYISDDNFQSLLPDQRNSYLWNKDIFEGQTSSDWNIPYKQVFYSNVVLDGIEKLSVNAASQQSYNAIKGSALFYRAFAFYNQAQSFAAPYDAGTATSLPGIPIRLASDVNIKVGRGTLKETYDQIINDLTVAEGLLPELPSYKNRPGKTAGLALLARVYLSMKDYDNAGVFSDACLKRNAVLIDYSTLDTSAVRPFPDPLPNGNDEVIFQNDMIPYSFFTDGIINVDSVLYHSFNINDLRKPLFFYEVGPVGIFFTGYKGLCIDEQYLIKAESLTRKGDYVNGLKLLNTLLEKRWAKNTFKPFVASDATSALTIILIERRKELVGRDMRWTDLRRLNQYSGSVKTLTRIIAGKVYTLPANDKRYVFPIPDDEIQRSGIAQNDR